MIGDLATTWMYMTIFAFMGGALVFLVWSVTAGQWKHLDDAAALPLSDGDHKESTGGRARHRPEARRHEGGER
jgi:nitrogen fixation-related uncharacterized protein